jgi:hypothetical protein
MVRGRKRERIESSEEESFNPFENVESVQVSEPTVPAKKYGRRYYVETCRNSGLGLEIDGQKIFDGKKSTRVIRLITDKNGRLVSA